MSSVVDLLPPNLPFRKTPVFKAVTHAIALTAKERLYEDAEYMAVYKRAMIQMYREGMAVHRYSPFIEDLITKGTCS